MTILFSRVKKIKNLKNHINLHDAPYIQTKEKGKTTQNGKKSYESISKPFPVQKSVNMPLNSVCECVCVCVCVCVCPRRSLELCVPFTARTAKLLRPKEEAFKADIDFCLFS